MASWSGKKLHFVTGRLAEHSLRDALDKLSHAAQFSYTLDVLKITVAALMTPDWIAKRINVPDDTDCVIVPGYCEGSLEAIELKSQCSVLRGPRDLRRLDVFFNQANQSTAYGDSDIEIIAEINHAPRLTSDEILSIAAKYSNDGADLIDVGCNPGETWSGVEDAVKMLKAEGYRVSIDSMNRDEVEPAVRAGAELVLSVNSSNREQAVDWGVELVAVPDVPADQKSLDDTVEYLATRGACIRIDPILSPIGFGFAESLGHYLDIRKRYVDAEIMMGIGNLTELTDTDSAGINLMLLGVCQELGIRSILTTAVIPWAKTSVMECNIARQLVYHSVSQKVLPKHVDDRLVVLRDVDQPEYQQDFFENLSEKIKDHNIRLFAEKNKIHLVTRHVHLSDSDPFRLMQRYLDEHGDRMNIGHAFYLGYEMCKAMTANTLSKNYQQDESLDWGYLTKDERDRCRIDDRRR
jgi:dihydropteroate synthase-like protein